MIKFIQENLSSIEQFCLTYRVKRLELFGSAVDAGRFDRQTSDIDFLVEFLPLKSDEHADCYFGLLEAIEGLLDRHVDLVMPKAVKNPYFLESINKGREVLYAA